MGNTISKAKNKEDKGKKAMVEGDQELNQYFVENYFYTEYGHKDVERAYTKMSWSLLRLD